MIDAAYGTGSGASTRPRPSRRARPCSRSTSRPVSTATPASPVKGAVRPPRPSRWRRSSPGCSMGDGPRLAGESRGGPDRDRRRAGQAVARRGRATSRAGSPAREPETNKWRSACVVVAGSPGMVGAARFSTSGAQRAGAGMVRWCVPGAAPDELPASEAVAAGACRRGLRRRRAGRAAPVPGARDRPGPRLGAGRGRLGATPRRRSRGAGRSSTPTGSGRSARSSRPRGAGGAQGAGGAHTARRRVRAARRHGTGRRRPPRSPTGVGGPVPRRAPRRRRAAEGLDDGGRRTRRPGLPRHLGLVPSCDGGDR